MTVIGICGGSGSGKTTLLHRLAEHYEQYNPSIFSMDNYYKPIEEQQKDGQGEVNFDLPSALNQKQLVDDFKRLIRGKSIEVIEYQFNSGQSENVLITIEPSELIIIEGLFVFEYAEVHKLLDFSAFVDVDPAIQLDRRIYRDQDSRGYSRSAIMYQWDNHVVPCYNKYLVPHETKAKFIYHNDSRSENDFVRLTEILEPILPQKK
jgi:uridine kinase